MKIYEILYTIFFIKNYIGHFPGSVLFYICGGTPVCLFYETYGEGHDVLM